MVGGVLRSVGWLAEFAGELDPGIAVGGVRT